MRTRSRHTDDNPAVAKPGDPVKRSFYRRLGYLAAGVGGLALLAHQSGLLGLLALFALLFSVLQLVALVSEAPAALDAFFPPKAGPERRERASDRYLAQGAAAYLVLSILLLATQLRQVENTLGGMRLFWSGGAAGLLAAVLLTLVLKRLSPSLYYKSERRFTVHGCLFTGSLLLGAATATLINHRGVTGVLRCTEYVLVKKTESSGRNHSFSIHIETAPAASERIDVSRDVYETLAEPGSVLLCTRRGRLGYPVVEAVRAVE